MSLLKDLICIKEYLYLERIKTMYTLFINKNINKMRVANNSQPKEGELVVASFSTREAAVKEAYRIRDSYRLNKPVETIVRNQSSKLVPCFIPHCEDQPREGQQSRFVVVRSEGTTSVVQVPLTAKTVSLGLSYKILAVFYSAKAAFEYAAGGTNEQQ
jgi:hypothetical protein